MIQDTIRAGFAGAPVVTALSFDPFTALVR